MSGPERVWFVSARAVMCAYASAYRLVGCHFSISPGKVRISNRQSQTLQLFAGD